MLGARRFWCLSLRSRLGMAAFAGLITTAALTVLLFQTASAALDVVSSARQMDEWVEVNTNLLTAARDYQGSSYRHVSEPTPAKQAAQDAARTRFESLLDAAGRLPVTDQDDRKAAAQVAHYGRIVLEYFRHSEEHVSTVEAKWRTGGMRPAMIEANRITQPIYNLDRVLRAAITRGHGKVVNATDRAGALINFALVASFFGMLLAIGFSVIVLMLLELRLRPGLRNLQDGVQAFRAGQLDLRIPQRGNDELTHLSRAFNAMAATIAQKHRALRDVQNGLERTIAHRTDELQRANEKLSAMDERRRAFLANISHELRTPLTIIRGEAEVALRIFDRPGADPHDALERIFEQTQDLSHMVDELLLLALAEAGGLQLDRKVHDLQDIIARVGSDFGVLARDMGGSIHAMRGPATHAQVDKDKLRRALATLVENALRHCPPGVNIVMEVSVQGEQAVIAVCDDGPGIDPAVTEQLFQRFKRGTTTGEGSGLGLNLAHALIEAHEGQINLQSRPGGGTRVVLSLPMFCAEMEAA